MTTPINQNKISNGTSIGANKNWLNENSNKYSKQWVALYNGKLIDVDNSKISLYSRLDKNNKVLLVFIP